VEEISKINQRLNGEEPEPPAVDWSLLRSQFPSSE
jgi:hypothetical protein